MDVQDMVREFHLKYGFHTCEPVATTPSGFMDDGRPSLQHMHDELKMLSIMAYNGHRHSADVRFFRLGLILEELSELVEGYEKRDEVLVADALADLDYVVNGTAVTHDLPLLALVQEVHRSNMTKDQDGRNKPKKGEDFSPPSIATVIAIERGQEQS